jgi:hypothetical protein
VSNAEILLVVKNPDEAKQKTIVAQQLIELVYGPAASGRNTGTQLR